MREHVDTDKYAMVLFMLGSQIARERRGQEHLSDPDLDSPDPDIPPERHPLDP